MNSNRPRLDIDQAVLERDIVELQKTRLQDMDTSKFYILKSEGRVLNFRVWAGPFDTEAGRDRVLATLPDSAACGFQYVARNPDDEDRRGPRNAMRVL